MTSGRVTAAASWIAAHLPVSSLNTIVAAPGQLWALRYPARMPCTSWSGGRDRSGRGRGPRPACPERDLVGARERAGRTASVIVASEELDGESGWRMLAPGELVHVRPDLSIRIAVVLTEPPARLVPLPADNPNVDT